MYDEHFTFTEGARLCCIVELRFLVLLRKLKIRYLNKQRSTNGQNHAR